MKKILIICAHFAPENQVASIRFTKIAKYLKKNGYNVSVLCCDYVDTEKIDTILAKDIVDLDNIYRTQYPSVHSLFEKIYKNQKKKNEVNFESIEVEKHESLFTKITSSSIYMVAAEIWNLLIEIALKQKYVKRINAEKNQYDVVISTFHPLAAHMAARKLKKDGVCNKWIADYRDVYYDTIRKENSVIRFKKKLLAKYMKDADYVTAVSSGMLKELNNYSRKYVNQSIKDKAAVVSNGFDLDDRKFLNNIDIIPKKLIFSYCGVIYYNEKQQLRNPEPLFRCVKELSDEGKIDISKIEFHYAGKSADMFERFAKDYGLEKRIVNHGFIERIESLRLQRMSDIILSLSWNTTEDKGIMTGKIYESFIAERNVLCLVSGNLPNSDLGKMIEDAHCGYVCEEARKDDYKKLKRWILNIYNEKMENGYLQYHPILDDIKPYQHNNLTKKFIKIINKITDEENKND